MAIYLGEHKVGYDANLIGFPSIDSCHAVCVQTSGGLFGFHNAGGSRNADFGPRAKVFCDFVKAHTGWGNGCVALFGVCFRGVRNKRGYTAVNGSGDGNWKVEMRAYATELGFTGKIKGFDLSKKILTESSYVEYCLIGTKTKVYYKKWAKVTTGPVVPVAPADLQRLKGDATSRNNDLVVQRYDLVNTTADAPCSIVATAGNKGEFHEVGFFQMESFN